MPRYNKKRGGKDTKMTYSEQYLTEPTMSIKYNNVSKNNINNIIDIDNSSQLLQNLLAGKQFAIKENMTDGLNAIILMINNNKSFIDKHFDLSKKLFADVIDNKYLICKISQKGGAYDDLKKWLKIVLFSVFIFFILNLFMPLKIDIQQDVIGVRAVVEYGALITKDLTITALTAISDKLVLAYSYIMSSYSQIIRWLYESNDFLDKTAVTLSYKDILKMAFQLILSSGNTTQHLAQESFKLVRRHIIKMRPELIDQIPKNIERQILDVD